jgi:hypothetical protein
MAETKIEFGLKAAYLESKIFARKFKEKIREALKRKDTVILDFHEVNDMSEGFADECFNQLDPELNSKEAINKKIIFRNVAFYIKEKIIKAFLSKPK